MSGSSGKVFFGCVEPDAAYRQAHHLWIDTNDGNRPKRWNGLAWGVATDKAATDAVADAKATISCLGSKAEARAVSALAPRLSSQGDYPSSLDHDGYASGEKPARQAAEDARRRANADDQLAKRIDGIEAGAEAPTLAVDPGQAIEPLRMGGVTFYGESARVIRDAQAVLQTAGAGQLEVVKRGSREGSPFFVVDGQVLISEGAVTKSTVAPLAIELGPRFAQDLLEELQSQISSSKLGIHLQEQVRQIIRDELKPGGILKRA